MTHGQNKCYDDSNLNYLPLKTINRVQVIIFIGTFLICAVLLQLAIKIFRPKPVSASASLNRFPSGNELPPDEDLVRFSKEQLEAYSVDDLLWLESYALTKKDEANAEIQAALWDDLLRRIDIAINGF